MANLPVQDGKFVLSQTIAGAGTITNTLSTQNTFVDKNIDVITTTPAGVLGSGSGSVEASSTATGLLGTATTTQPSSGNYVTVEGSATVGVSSAGWMDTTGSQSVTIADVYYPVNNATFTVDGASVKSNSAGYVPASTTVGTVSTGTVTTSVANAGMSTYFNSGTSSSNNVTLTPKYTNTAGYIVAHSTATNAGGVEYYSIKAQSVSETTTTVSSTTATRGTRTEGVGWNASSTTLDVATFNNSATSGKTYVDISATTSAPVLVAGDYLYIDKGWTDYVKISLARLVPDGSDVKGHSEYILSGHSAYDNDGTLVAGSIPTYEGAYTVA